MSKEKSCLVLREDVEPFTIPLEERIKELEAENEQLKKWQIKPTEAICLTDLSCRHKKVFKND